MKNSMKAALTLSLITVVGAGGVALVANAKDNPANLGRSDRLAQTTDNEADEANEGPEGSEGDHEANEANENAQYESLTKITAQQAQQTAEAAQGSTATEVELDVDDSSLVYAVEFANAEVTVDAGNGNILKTELEGQEENDATEVPIQGSIQVPDSDH